MRWTASAARWTGARRATAAAAVGEARQFVPPGHFFSPVPSLTEVRQREARLFGDAPRALPGIELREEAQLALLDALQPFYDALAFPARRSPEFRYFYENPSYSYSDAIFLHCMIRHVRPARIVEVGIYEGRAWTEAYLLRAFLAHSSAFEIALFNTFLERFHEARFRERMPLCLKNTGGSIWLRRAR